MAQVNTQPNPLNSYDAEYKLLSIFCQHKEALGYLADKIIPEYFTDINKLLFIGIFDLYQTGFSIDVITIQHILRKLPNGERVSANIISGLFVPVDFEKIEAYLSIVAESYKTRNYQAMVLDISKAIVEKKSSAILSEIVSKYSTNIDLGLSRPRNIDIVIESYEKELEESIVNGNTYDKRLVKFHIEELDRHDLMRPGNIYTFGARPSQGKMLRIEEDILTPTGFVKLKTLKIGDEVASIDGKKSFIKGYFPQGKKQLYEMKLIDGRTILSGAEHLWEVNSYRFNENKKILSTLEIMNLLNSERYKGRISLPVFEGNFGVKKDFMIHPYLLGVLLGDGSLTDSTIFYKNDLFVKEKIETLLPDDMFIETYSEKSNCFKFVIKSNIPKENKITRELQNLGLSYKLSYEKFIPKEYLNCSYEQRLQLLNGLLDSDGYQSKQGYIEYSTSSKQLALDFQQLCWSLGARCNLCEKKTFLKGQEKRISYRLRPSSKLLNSSFFSTPIKSDNSQIHQNSPLTIVSVKETNIFEECACISVTHERELYITKDYIITHNTSAMIQAAYGNAFIERKRVVIFSLEMTEEEIMEKIFCRHVGIDSTTWIRMSPEKKLKEMRAFKAYLIANKIELIIDTESENISSIVNKVKVLANQKKIDLVCIDYMQLIDSGLINRTMAEEVDHIMKSIKKHIAMKHDTAVILLSQMSKKVEQEGYRMPILADLLNGGAIEAASTSVYFLHSVSPMVRKYFDEEGTLENKGETLFVAQKARFGMKGILKLWFIGGVNIFVKNYDEVERIKNEVNQKCQHFLTN